MNYKTTLTSKGTVTVAAPLRKSLGLKTGQHLTMSLNKQGQIVLHSGTKMADFEKLRSKINKKIPKNKKGLTGEDLKKSAALAWTQEHRD